MGDLYEKAQQKLDGHKEQLPSGQDQFGRTINLCPEGNPGNLSMNGKDPDSVGCLKWEAQQLKNASCISQGDSLSQYNSYR